MSQCLQMTQRLPLLADFPPTDRERAAKALRVQAERQHRAEEARNRKAEAAVESHRRRMHDLTADGAIPELRKAIAAERHAFRQLRQPPGGLERDYLQDLKASQRRIGTLVRGLNIDADALRDVQAGFRGVLDGLLADTDAKVVPGCHTSRHLLKWLGLSPLNALPLHWGVEVPPPDPHDPHRWSIHRAPFFGFLFQHAYQASDNYRVGHEHILRPASAQVGNIATMLCEDASSFDYASVTTDSQIAFGFVAPTTGLVEVLVDAQATIDRHEVHITDEFGFSDAWCSHLSYLSMNVLHPDVPQPSLAAMSHFLRESDGDNVSAVQTNLLTGQHYFAQLFSTGPVTAGEHIVVAVGARSFNKARADDMGMDSRSDCQWFINSVGVRIAP